jgi:hypothetical protein
LGTGVKVAVIDSGVHAANPHVQGVAGGVGIDDQGHVHADYVDRLGHGTAVAAVIREKAPLAQLFAVKVFDRQLAATGVALVRAIEWSRETGVDIINLSLGTTNADHEPSLRAAVTRALQAGILVVAAAARWLADHSGGRTHDDRRLRIPPPDSRPAARKKLEGSQLRRRERYWACGTEVAGVGVSTTSSVG